MTRNFSRLLPAVAGLASVFLPLAGGALSSGAARLAPQRRDTSATRPIFPSGSAAISGVVLDSATNQPVRRVTVTATEQGATAMRRLTVTGDDGRFVFTALSAGRYIVAAAKPAFLPTAFGVSKPPRPGSVPTGSAIALTDGQSLNDVVLRLTRGAVLTGTVRDSEGRPVRGVSITLAYSTRAPLTGEQTLASSLGPSSATTDSTGAYRIFGISPGTYVVRARLTATPAAATEFTPALTAVANDFEITSAGDLRRIAEGRAANSSGPPAENRRRPTHGYAPVFYPGTTALANATPITLVAGEERAGIDFQILLQPQSRITGTVTGADGTPAAQIGVRLIERDPFGAGTFATGAYATTDALGRYALRSIPAGDYRIEVRPTEVASSASPKGWARADVTVTANGDAEVSLQLRAGLSISGLVTMESAPGVQPPDFARSRIALMNRDGLLTPAAVTPDGRLSVENLIPGRYRWAVMFATTSAWFPKNSTVGGQDALDDFFDLSDNMSDASIVLTTQVSELAGTIQDSSGRPAQEYFLVVFPADKSLWTWATRRIAHVRPASDGQFLFRNLPPGDYLLGALTDLDPAQMYEPALLNELVAGSVPVKIGEGEKKTQNLRVR